VPIPRVISGIGRRVDDAVSNFGGLARFTAATAYAILFASSGWRSWRRLGPQLYFIGTTSVPVLALTGAFIGAILAIEGYGQFAAFGLETRLGGVVNISVIKQIGPVLAAVMLAGRVGCALAAELGSMRVTDQLDAMRVMGVDPIRTLAAPRVVACTVMIPGLTVVSNLCGIVGGWLFLVPVQGVPARPYWEFTRSFIDTYDVANGLIKSVLFGLAIGIICCFKGFTCRPGAQGVGRASTEAFVVSFVAIIAINLVMAKLLNDIQLMISGGELRQFN
jgi:phospholipid/cholesterol/gamma-HCH transport system permease protein